MHYAPLIAFGAVYGFTCLLGAFLILADYSPFVVLFEHFSGTKAPTVTGSTFWTNIGLLCLAPVLLFAGYIAADCVRPLRRRSRKRFSINTSLLTPPRWLPAAIFVVVASFGAIDLVRAGVLANAASWLDYQAWIDARAQAFRQIGFFGFANLYLFMPLAAAFVLVSGRPSVDLQAAPVKRVLRVAGLWLPTAVTLGFAMLLFQKKAAVVSLVLILAATLIHSRPTIRRLRLKLWAAVLGVGLVYLVMVVAPVYRTVWSDPGLQLGEPWDRVPAVALYTALAPLTRTSAPALYYPVVYPKHHPYYGLDVGQDILGIGQFPDDSKVVWRFMNPNLNGTTAAPYQFRLYSQVGLLGALLGSAVLGFALGLAWRLTRLSRVPAVWTSLAGALTLLFAVYLAIDSARNGITVSYGVIWGFAFVAVLALTVAGVNGIKRRWTVGHSARGTEDIQSNSRSSTVSLS